MIEADWIKEKTSDLEDDGRNVLMIAIQRRRQFQFFARQREHVRFAGTGYGQIDFTSRLVANNGQQSWPSALVRFYIKIFFYEFREKGDGNYVQLDNFEKKNLSIVQMSNYFPTYVALGSLQCPGWHLTGPFRCHRLKNNKRRKGSDLHVTPNTIAIQTEWGKNIYIYKFRNSRSASIVTHRTIMTRAMTRHDNTILTFQKNYTSM